jgi:hypothetical protein
MSNSSRSDVASAQLAEGRDHPLPAPVLADHLLGARQVADVARQADEAARASTPGPSRIAESVNWVLREGSVAPLRPVSAAATRRRPHRLHRRERRRRGWPDPESRRPPFAENFVGGPTVELFRVGVPIRDLARPGCMAINGIADRY